MFRLGRNDCPSKVTNLISHLVCNNRHVKPGQQVKTSRIYFVAVLKRQVAKRKRIRAVEVRIVALGENADRKVDALAIDSGEKIQPGHSAPRINSGITGLPFIGT